MLNPVELAIHIDREVERLDELDRPGHGIEHLLDSVLDPNREEWSNAIRALLRFPEARTAVLFMKQRYRETLMEVILKHEPEFQHLLDEIEKHKDKHG